MAASASWIAPSSDVSGSVTIEIPMLTATDVSSVAQRQRQARRVADALGDHHRLAVALQTLEQERELVASEAGHRVHRAQQAAEALGEHRQQQVAGGMAERVVDLLERVHVQEQQAHRGAGAPRTVQGNSEPVQEQHAVGEPGQRIVQRLAGQLDLGALALDGVADRPPERGRGQLGRQQVVLGSEAHRLHAELVAVFRKHDDGRVRGRDAQLGEGVQRLAAVPRQVEQDAGGAALDQLLRRVGHMLSLRDQQPLGPDVPEHLDDLHRRTRILLYQQDSCGFAAARGILCHLSANLRVADDKIWDAIVAFMNKSVGNDALTRSEERC